MCAKAMLGGVAAILLAPVVKAQTVVYAANYPSINAAVAACPPGPCTVIVPGGVNTISTPVNLRSNLTLQGELGAIVKASTNFPAGKAMINAAGSRVLLTHLTSPSAHDTSNVGVDDTSAFLPEDMVGISDSGQNNGTVAIVSAVSSSALRFSKALGAGFPQGQNVYRITPVLNVTIQNLTLQGGTSWGIMASYGRNVTIRDCIVDTCAYGMMCTSNIGLTLTRNTVQNNGYGIRLVANDGADVLQNTISKNLKACIALIYTNNTRIEGNNIEGIYDAFLTNDNGDGITISGGWRNTVLRNTIKNISCYGMWVVNDGSYNLIKENTIDHTYASGIQIRDSDNDRVEDNTISNLDHSAGLSFVNTKGSIMIGNTVENTARPAFFQYTTACYARDNKGIANALLSYTAPKDNAKLVLVGNTGW